ncbi:Deoxycytidine monophosphate (dCMP) deaminase [Vanrija albida]|uniref:dCMP deaminase n=1 Tax=Vanrija albida TaxID=181172 RepID=A0ABR3Q956_9TREE
MIIALVGTPSAGKHTVLEYLVAKHDFVRLELAPAGAGAAAPAPPDEGGIGSLSIVEPTTFASPDALLDYTTRHWQRNFVTTALSTHSAIEPFLKRPFFLLVGVDGPLRARFLREKAKHPGLSLDSFVDAHDALLNGSPERPATEPPSGLLSPTPTRPAAAAVTRLPTPSPAPTDLARVLALAQLTVFNRFGTVQGLYAHLDALDLLDEQRLRPGWDMYFMTLASLASHRSNCMKRRVGALLVRSKRIVSTGYNGTPRGTRNCNEGGCPRCNGPARGGESLNACLCLHAEENALLEAGKERIGSDSIIYCNTCPCLLCSVKIVQCGVREVVYNQSYSMDEASARVLEEGGVLLRQLHMPNLML